MDFLSIAETAKVLAIGLPVFRKYIYTRQVRQPRKSLSGNLYYKPDDLGTLARKILILKTKNQKFYKYAVKQKRREKSGKLSRG